jgi:hypothetical protein
LTWAHLTARHLVPSVGCTQNLVRRSCKEHTVDHGQSAIHDSVG